MTTITMDEITRNAVLAALDERAARLSAELVKLERDRDSAGNGTTISGGTSEDRDRAYVWNLAALNETNMARLQIGEAKPWSESEMRMAAGDR